ncbi:hypothetical protein [Clostridium sp.]|uniref:hypothetical protein n=1 Tax=Clostridium sp. TaxID=1506 RepID=UPI00283E8C50|nr:hypothetical protein [Clostridium sp.]MDR3596492.1 hypothetical protein [Clostridium sp.]
MKVIDCYYRLEKLNPEKSKSRFDLVYNSDIYEPVHNPNPKGEVFIYLGSNPNIKANGHRKTDLTISARNKHLTSVFIPEIEKPNLAYGDYSQDAILIILSEKSIELLISKGNKNILPNLYNLLFDDELNEEIEAFRIQIKEPIKIAENILSKVSL